MKKIIILCVVTLHCIALNAQIKIENLEETYSQYFELPRETIYLHLNKSEFVHNENIWFKGYLYDRKNNLPATKTSNIHVGLYNNEGVLIDKKLYLGYEGYVRGDFKIDSTITTGNYFLKASTNWMRNFIEDDSHTTQISITDLKKEPSSNEKVTTTETTRESEVENSSSENTNYDFQLLPESGHALLGQLNTIGIKILDHNGIGVKYADGIVLDQNNKEITKFKTNTYGMGKFLITYEKGQSYKAVASLPNGNSIEQVLPVADKSGVSLNVVNSAKDRVIITINKTLELDTEEFVLLFQRDGIIKRFNIRFNGESKIDVTLLRKNLIKDINIVTLLDNKGTPLAERIFYNHNVEDVNDVNLIYNQKINDSLLINISSIANDSVYYNYSISVLPENSEAYNHPDNTISTLKLQPYINGVIEQPKYYFTDTDRRKKYDLDLLLLTQGWSRYRWSNIFNKPPQQLFKFENGLSLSGRVNEAIKQDATNSIYLFSFKNNPSKLINLNSDKSFKVDNLFPETNELIKISLVGDAERKKSPGIYTRISNNLIEDKMNVDAASLRSIKSRNYLPPSFFDLNGFITDETVELDEVYLRSTTRKKDDAYTAGTIVRGKVVDLDEDSYRYGSLLNVIERNGFRTAKDPVGRITIVTPGNNTIRGALSPLIFMDNAPITDFDLLGTFPIGSVGRIYFDKSGVGYGVRGAGGVINIYTRRGDSGYTNPNASSPVYSKKVDMGFEPLKIFYAPRYASYQTFGFKKYGIVHWFSDVILKGKETSTLRVPHCEQKSLIFYIEGMSNDGHLISKVLKLEIPN